MAPVLVDRGLMLTRWAWSVHFDAATSVMRLAGDHRVIGIPQLVTVEGVPVPWEPQQRRRILTELGPGGSGSVLVRLAGDQVAAWDGATVEVVDWSEPKVSGRAPVVDADRRAKVQAVRGRRRG